MEPSKNYQLFLKATQIDVVHEKLADSLHLHKDHMEELKNYEIVSTFPIDYDNLLNKYKLGKN